jgi:periplasmic divalent cation tolerance protein
MKLYYVTLNTTDEARAIGRALLEQQIALCVNWFPITCLYRWEGSMTEEPEVVLVIKTQDGYQLEVEAAIRQHVSYTNFIGELTPTSVNQGFLDWLNAEVPVLPRASSHSG